METNILLIRGAGDADSEKLIVIDVATVFINTVDS